MKFERFELAVVELASRGMRLTVPNVAVALRVEPQKAEQWLDRMAYDGRLDVELDEDAGIVFYRVRGLTPNTQAMVRTSAATTHTLTHGRHKSPMLGALCGLLVPGFGLLYAAPWKVALIGSLVTLVAVKMLGAVPLLGPMLGSVALGICALASAVLGVLYTRQYNAEGRRAPLERRHVVAHTAAWPQAAARVVDSAFRRA